MDDHASIFYLKPDGPYLLCYDRDLEKLPAPVCNTKRAHKELKGLVGKWTEPFLLVGKASKYPHMRVIYDPDKTEHTRRPDGFVDRIVRVDPEWIDVCAKQYQLVFPRGLPAVLIETYEPAEY